LHDILANSEGSFEKAMVNIKKFKDKVRHTVLKMTITKRNINSLNGLSKLSKDLGVDFGYDFDLLPCNSNLDLLEIDENDIKLMKINSPEVFKKTLTKKICIGGTCSCTIDQDGNLFPCRLSNMKIGNVLETPLVDLWNSEFAKNIARDFFNQPLECTSCNELYPFCFYCPMKELIKGFDKLNRTKHNCNIARKNRILKCDE
jgi:radical SAM protein with 4Fe4S-binding SPASM domain